MWGWGAAFLEQPNEVLQPMPHPPPQPSLRGPFSNANRSMNVSKNLMMRTPLTPPCFLLNDELFLNFLAVRMGSALEHEAYLVKFCSADISISPQNVEPTRVSLPAFRSGVLVPKHAFSYRSSVSYACHKIRVRDSGETESDVTNCFINR